MEIPIKMDDLGVPLFSETPRYVDFQSQSLMFFFNLGAGFHDVLYAFTEKNNPEDVTSCNFARTGDQMNIFYFLRSFIWTLRYSFICFTFNWISRSYTLLPISSFYFERYFFPLNK